MTGDELYVMNTSTCERVKAKPDKNPLSNLKSTMLFHVNGFDSNFRDALMLGIVVGYDWKDDSFKEVCERWNWTDEDADLLRKLHEQYEELLEVCDKKIALFGD